MPTVRLIVEEAAASLFKFSLDVFRAVPRDLKGGNFLLFSVGGFSLAVFLQLILPFLTFWHPKSLESSR